MTMPLWVASDPGVRAGTLRACQSNRLVSIISDGGWAGRFAARKLRNQARAGGTRLRCVWRQVIDSEQKVVKCRDR